MFPSMNGKQKITVGAVVGVLTLVGTVFAGAWTLDGRYASRHQVARGLENVLDAVADLKCSIIREELNNLALKEERNNITDYDRARKNDLELRWQRECLSGGNS